MGKNGSCQLFNSLTAGVNGPPIDSDRDWILVAIKVVRHLTGDFSSAVDTVYGRKKIGYS